MPDGAKRRDAFAGRRAGRAIGNVRVERAAGIGELERTVRPCNHGKRGGHHGIRRNANGRPYGGTSAIASRSPRDGKICVKDVHRVRLFVDEAGRTKQLRRYERHGGRRGRRDRRGGRNRSRRGRNRIKGGSGAAATAARGEYGHHQGRGDGQKWALSDHVFLSCWEKRYAPTLIARSEEMVNVSSGGIQTIFTSAI